MARLKTFEAAKQKFQLLRIDGEGKKQVSIKLSYNEVPSIFESITPRCNKLKILRIILKDP